MFSASWLLVLDQMNAMAAAPEAALSVTMAGSAEAIQFVPLLLTFVGDNPEVQKVCGVSDGPSARHPCRACMVHKTDTHCFYSAEHQAGPASKCVPRTSTDLIEKTVDALCKGTQKERVDALRAGGSLAGVPTCFNYYAGSATAAGVLHATPQDPMHHFGCGLAPYLVSFIGETAHAACAVVNSQQDSQC